MELTIRSRKQPACGNSGWESNQAITLLGITNDVVQCITTPRTQVQHVPEHAIVKDILVFWRWEPR
jgi:hypothetical protein